MTYRSSWVRVCEAASLSSARCSSLWHEPCACGKVGAEPAAGLACAPAPAPWDPQPSGLPHKLQTPLLPQALPAPGHDPGVLSTHPALPSRPPQCLAVLTMGRVSSRWYGLPLLRILVPWFTLFACCFCRHLRSWMLQGLKLLLG